MSVLRRAVVAAASALALATLTVSALAAEEAKEDPVVAIVNGEEVLLSTVLETLPEQYKSNIELFYPMALQQAVDIVLLRQAAEQAIPADDPELQKRMKELRRQVVFQIYLARELKTRISEEDVKAAYDAYVASNPPVQETRARHILVETENEARELILELDGGANFAALAKERSTGPSAPQGGDIGYFTDDGVLGPFAKAAAALQSGEYGKEPVQTEYGWHVIKVEDRRMTEPPVYEEVRGQFRQQIERNVLTEMVTAERGAAEVEFFDLDGSPFEVEETGTEEPKADQPKNE